MDYKDSGVDRNAAYGFIDSLQAKAKKTMRPEVLSEIGDYGGFFEAPRSMKDPIWVASTDGVGTKLLLAEEVGGRAHSAVGQDAVAMCVNDLISCRAEPIIFLDYLATGKLNPETLSFLMDGIVNACHESGCALIGGETAQMPGFYPDKRYDVAGFSLGVLERSHRLNPKNVQAGDIVMGIESAGFHSNGFSLVRKIVAMQNWNLTASLDGEVLGEALLKPTRLYVKPMLEVFRAANVKAAAHITGGGLIENLPRGFDEKSVRIAIEEKKVPTPSLMRRFVDAGRMKKDEAFSTWNMGIGFCFMISPEEKAKLPQNLPFKMHEIGRVEAKTDSNQPSVVIS